MDEAAQPNPHSKESFLMSYPVALLVMFGLAVPMTAAIHFADCARDGSSRDRYDVYARPVAARSIEKPAKLENHQELLVDEVRVAFADVGDTSAQSDSADLTVR